MKVRRRRSRRLASRRRRPVRPLWPLVGLALAAAAVAVMASRRRRGVDDPDWLPSSPPEYADAGAGPGSLGIEPPRTAAHSPEAAANSERELTPPEQLWIAGPAGNLFIRACGEPAGGHLPVLFVHGLAGNGGQWALQLDQLRRWRQALALDPRGHGDPDPTKHT